MMTADDGGREGVQLLMTSSLIMRFLGKIFNFSVFSNQISPHFYNSLKMQNKIYQIFTKFLLKFAGICF